MRSTLKFVGSIIVLLFLGAGCVRNEVPKVTEQTTLKESDSATVQVQESSELKQQRELTYRKECQTEWSEISATVDKIVRSIPNVTMVQAQNVARNAGIADANGYILNKDVWVKDCLDKKVAIFK